MELNLKNVMKLHFFRFQIIKIMSNNFMNFWEKEYFYNLKVIQDGFENNIKLLREIG